MTKAKISEYDAVAANNTDVNGVNIDEGCAPSGMNNMGREIMAALKRFETGADGDSLTVGGNLIVSGTSTVAALNTSGAVVFNDAGADVDFRVEGDTNANLIVADAGVDKVGIGTNTFNTNGGVLQVSNGISFPADQSACADAHTLDDYEEGTWTPTLKTTSTNFSSITYSGQLGDYVKVGGFIYLQFFVQIASVSGGSGDIQLTGLPFASSGSGRPNSGGYVQLVNGWTTNNPSNFDASGASSLDYNIQYRATSNGVTAGLPVAAATALSASDDADGL
jgi:hypothetical protein